MMNKHKVAPFDNFPSTRAEKLSRKIQEVVDGKAIAITMAIVTIWVLFGDDIRLRATNKSADEAFFITFFICLLLFIIEIIANSIFIHDYKFSFFFWLDVVATISLVPDIPLIRDPFLLLFGVELFKVDVDFNTTAVRNTISESYITRGIQTIRYIRLVRIVKLYKYFTKKRGEDPNAQNPSNNMDAELLGKKLSDITTRRVIIGVLLLLLLLPILQVNTVDNAKYYGLQQLYWVGSSGHLSDLNGPEVEYMNDYGWGHMIVQYSKCSDTSGNSFPLLWLYVPNLSNSGIVEDIVEAYDPITENTWTYHKECSGKVVSNDCEYRNEEMKVVIYGPSDCPDPGCKDVKAFARFNMKEYSQNQAVMSILITIFVGIILAVASITFARDTKKIVIKPVNKMVRTIKNLAKDPLKISEVVARPVVPRESILEETIDKIGILLKINFGTRGSMIMSELLTDTEINFKTEGKKDSYVIGIVKIQDSELIIDSLQEEVLVFINKIAKIIHTCSARWDGHICRNDMGSFLIVWPESKATEALFAMIKTSAELHRATDIMAYKSNPKIVARFQDQYVVNIHMSLHIGEIIEGAIGSNIKVMPDYISPSINLGKTIQALNNTYETNIIMSDSFYNCLNPKAQQVCRKIDCVMLKNAPEAFQIYTFDLSEVSLPDFKRMNMNDDEYKIENRKPGDPIIIGMANMQCEVYQLFGIDNDILGMQKCIPSYFTGLFNNGLDLYFKGQWQESIQNIEQALGLKPGDGPCLSLKKYMEERNSKAPEGWPGYRQIN